MQQRKHIRLYIIIVALIGLAYVGYQLIKQQYIRTQREQLLTLSGQQAAAFLSGQTNTDIPNGIQSMIKDHATQHTLTEKFFSQALALHAGESSQDYYNRGVIKLARAYDHATIDTNNDVSSLQFARKLSQEAVNDFVTANKIQIGNTLTPYINTNHRTAMRVAATIDIKACFAERSNIIIQLQNITDHVDMLQKLLQRERSLLQQKREIIITNFDQDCYTHIDSTLQQTAQSVHTIKQYMHTYSKRYAYDFINKVEQPAQCIGTSLESIQPTIDETTQSLEEFQNTHTNILTVLENEQLNGIRQLCQQNTDDAQGNQQLQNSLNNLMQDLEKNLNQGQPGQQKEEGGGEEQSDQGQGEKDQQQEQPGNDNQSDPKPKEGTDVPLEQGNNKSNNTDTPPNNNGQPQYQDVLNTEEQNLLQQTENTNQQRIQQMQQIKKEGQYNPEQYLQQLFHRFFGNEGDFTDIEKQEAQKHAEQQNIPIQGR